MSVSLFFDNLRSFFAGVDRIIYNLISWAYGAIIDMANAQIFSSSDINDIVTRIYGLLGIFMLFKVSFSIITYIVDPDNVSNKDQGVGNIIKKIIITLVLVITVPFIFDLLYDFQSAILSDNVIPTLIFGNENEDDASNYTLYIDPYCKESDIKATAKNAGDYLALITFRPFFQIDEDASSSKKEAIKIPYCLGDVTRTALPDANRTYYASVNGLLKHNLGIYEQTVGVGSLYKHPDNLLDTVVDTVDTLGIFNSYTINYNILISTIVGFIVLGLMIGFCFDFAVRTIKLTFLEVVAPIAIISYIEPNSSKNGLFKKWVNEVKNTWLSLFIRLAAIYLVIFAITLLMKAELRYTNGYEQQTSTIWLTLFILIGALIFARQIPKLIESMLGIKLNGTFNINPFKKVEAEAGIKGFSTIPGRLSTAVGGMAISAIGAGYGHYRAKKEFKQEQDKISDSTVDRNYQERLNRIRGNYANYQQQFANQYTENMRNATNNADYMQAKNLYDEQMNKLNQKYNSELATARQEMEQTKIDNIEKRAKNEKDYYDKFSNRHAVTAGIIEALRGTRYGFQKGAKNPREVISNSIAAAKYSAKEKNDSDTYSIKQRVDDFLTNIGGVKNSSGTTSMNKKEMKQVNEQLKDISNYMSQLNTALAGVNQNAPGAISYMNDGKGNMVMKTVDGFDYSSVGMTRKDIDRLIDELAGLRAEEKAANKRLNELRDYDRSEKKK